MGALLKHQIAYTSDSATLFARIVHMPWAVYLDSGQPQSQYGRYDIMSANPFITITCKDGGTELTDKTGVRVSTDDPFTILKNILSAFHIENTELPFEGGAIGYFAYDLVRSIEVLPELALDSENIPQMMVGIYDWAVVVDHREQKTWLVSHEFDADTREQWPELCELFDVESQPAEPEKKSFKVSSEVKSNMDLPTYAKAFVRIQHYIHEGDCYQVNLAQRFSAQATGDAWLAYQHLRKISPAPFLAYMQLPELQILSASPERFLQVKGDHVETRPIKGTRPRSADNTQDKQNSDDLKASLKDRAENLMIVDLLRNDISKTCVIGSVKADRLFALESFANVHHLVSTVTGQLAPDKTAIDLLKGCFPGGSITGAPKLRAAEIIEELEPNKRGVYCGAIGYIGFDGNMDTNIAIRTAVYSKGEIRFWAGGGIVADSEMQKEYCETWDKASSMLELMQHFSII
ncbi:aminodeoxychorismate synthase component I [Methyloradius palustris]|uniref:aminodeoxychorismate synthase n=1 Tax=Methyloradius palustris TaxID=2778876 RepID=A0A8D5G062_9PROT|nr:aminodeoxychorismate synthase component I [Methyloradius palustris]BCM24935.1 aminodeoxychorismate synthase, component I [Methyloradius palustris]